ncbi:hypothetical protein BHE74_00033315 [Ensete ventricosum]|nr:hypothetical protein BHE74_00033315 [Ensete ventricosum]RZS16098.1 hypothetical protein BHM03_00048113 [Ensete ventricosum]
MEQLSYNQMMGKDQAWASCQGLDDVVGPHREFAEGIGKLARNTSGDRQKKTVRLTARIPEAVELEIPTSKSLVSGGCTITAQVSERLTMGKLPRSTIEPPIPWNQGAFDGLTDGAGE